jgi:hypothetical protein
MPKEVIVNDRDVFGPDSSACSLLQVRWGRNGFVEFGSRIVHGADHSDYVPTKDERPGDAGKPIRGHYMSLDRAQINDLIRNLRKARDQAFGRDE